MVSPALDGPFHDPSTGLTLWLSFWTLLRVAPDPATPFTCAHLSVYVLGTLVGVLGFVFVEGTVITVDPCSRLGAALLRKANWASHVYTWLGVASATGIVAYRFAE